MSRLETWKNALFVTIFLAALALPLRSGLPSLRDALPPSSPTFSKTPLLASVRNALFLPPEYERRYNNHYEGRDRRVRLYNETLLNVFQARVFPNVLRGREDWLFWTGEGNMDDYQNAHPFSYADLEEIEQKLSAMHERLAAQGIAFLVVSAPNKETIYPEMLPPEIAKIGKQSRLDQLLAYLAEQHSAVNVLDLRPVLLANKTQHQLYYRTDTHWNDYGAYYASAQIFKAFQPEFPQLQLPGLEAYHTEEETISGDLARLLLTDPLFSESALQLETLSPPRVRFLEKTDRVITVSEVEDAALPRAVIFRDSFANSLEPFLSGRFKRAVYPWSFQVDWELIEREQPDLVIYELAERYLHHLKEIVP